MDPSFGFRMLSDALSNLQQSRYRTAAGQALSPMGADAQAQPDVSGSTKFSVGSSASLMAKAKPFMPMFQDASTKYGVPLNYLLAIGAQESQFNPQARGPTNDVGLMQFTPPTAKQYGVNPLDPASSIDGAARLLRDNYQRLGSWDKAINAYNTGGRHWNAAYVGSVGQYAHMFAGVGGEAPREPGTPAAPDAVAAAPVKPEQADSGAGPKEAVSGDTPGDAGQPAPQPQAPLSDTQTQMVLQKWNTQRVKQGFPVASADDLKKVEASGGLDKLRQQLGIAFKKPPGKEALKDAHTNPASEAHSPDQVKTAIDGGKPVGPEVDQNGYFPYNSVYGKGFTLPQLIYNIKRANPNINPAVLAGAIGLMQPMFSAAATENYHATMQYIRQQAIEAGMEKQRIADADRADLQAQKDAAAEERQHIKTDAYLQVSAAGQALKRDRYAQLGDQFDKRLQFDRQKREDKLAKDKEDIEYHMEQIQLGKRRISDQEMRDKIQAYYKQQDDLIKSIRTQLQTKSVNISDPEDPKVQELLTALEEHKNNVARQVAAWAKANEASPGDPVPDDTKTKTEDTTKTLKDLGIEGE